MLSSSDELSIKCTAKIGNVYWQSVVEKTRQAGFAQMKENMCLILDVNFQTQEAGTNAGEPLGGRQSLRLRRG